MSKEIKDIPAEELERIQLTAERVAENDPNLTEMSVGIYLDGYQNGAKAEYLRHLSSSSKPEGGLRWLKADLDNLPIGEVAIRYLTPVPGNWYDKADAGKIKRMLNDSYHYKDIFYLGELVSYAEPAKKNDNGFKQGYACALTCIIKSHGCDTPVEEAYKAGLPPLKKLKGIIDDYDYEILSKYFK